MRTSTWTRRLLTTTRGRVIALLRRRSRTVNELADALELTDNAVRAHLATLERDGLVRQSGTRRGTRKPHLAYGLTEEAEHLFPKAYAPVLGELLAVFAARLPAEEVEGILREVGHRMAAPHLESLSGEGLGVRLTRAAEVLAELGGVPEVEQCDDALVIRGLGCPLSRVVTDHPAACKLVETILSDLLGVPVREQCERGDVPRCCFEVDGAVQTV